MPDMPAAPIFTPVPQPAITVGEPLNVVSDFTPSGDQPEAIAELVAGLEEDDRLCRSAQWLLNFLDEG